MKFTNKLLSASLVLTISLNFTACKRENVNVENNAKKTDNSICIDIKDLKFPYVTILQDKENSSEIFNIGDLKLNHVGKLSNVYVSDILYDTQKGVDVFLIKVQDKEGKFHNEIRIKTKSKGISLKNSLIYSDVKMSPGGNKIAFRSFKDTSLTSPEGMRIYDIDNDKEIKLNSNVLVSGSVYQWVDDNDIIYYGAIAEKPNSNKIYKYNIKTNEESVYLDNIDGYCSNFVSVDNKRIVILENNKDNYRLCYFDLENKGKKVISENIQDMSNGVIDEEKNNIYFIGKSLGVDSCSVFSIDLLNLNLSQLTYELPKNVEGKAGLAINKDGNLVFCGNESEGDYKDVFIYDKKNSSTNLVTENPDSYKIFKEN